MKRFLPGDLVTIPQQLYGKAYEQVSISLYDLQTGMKCGSFRPHEVAIVVSVENSDRITLFSSGCLGMTSAQYVVLA